MPIANCFIKSEILLHTELDPMVEEWADKIGIDKEDITLNVITDFSTFAKSIPAMINLYLPTLWSDDKVEEIQTTLSALILRYLPIGAEDVFIMTTMIESGKVISNGKLEHWNP